LGANECEKQLLNDCSWDGVMHSIQWGCFRKGLALME